MARPINLIVVHCSASPNGDGLFRGEAVNFKTPLDIIDGWHAERGFQRSHEMARFRNPQHQHVGYHHIISCNGATFTGRSPDEIGAHVVGYNANSLGICMTGTDSYTLAQWRRLAELVRTLCKRHDIPLCAPSPVAGRLRDGVCGHRDLSPDTNHNGRVEPFEWLKTCPGFNVADWIANDLQPLTQHLLPEAQP